MGLFTDFVPKHARRYAKLGEAIKAAVGAYMDDVLSSSFPTDKESFPMDESIVAEIAYELPVEQLPLEEGH